MAGQTYFIAIDSVAVYEFELTLTFGQIQLTEPNVGTELLVGHPVEIEFSAFDTNMQLSSIEAFVGSNSLGVLTSPPFTFSFIPTGSGIVSILAVGTNALGEQVLALDDSFVVAPENDNFADATVIPGNRSDGTFSGNTTYATSEPGEPSPLSLSGRTIWWRWTPSNAGYVTVSVPSSRATVSVYTGSSLDTLQHVPVQYSLLHPPTPIQPGFFPASIYSFTPEPGATYYFCGNGGSGPIPWTLSQRTLNISPFSNPDPIRAFVGQPVPLQADWLASDPPATAIQFAIGTNSLIYWPFDLDSQITEVGVLTNVDAPPYQAAWIPNAVGDFYIWARTTNLFGFTKQSLKTKFRVNAANDSFTNATDIPSDTRTTNYSFTMAGASVEQGEPPHGKTQPIGTLWWKWTPSYSASVRLKAVCGDHGVSVDVFTGSDLADVKGIANNSSRAYRSGFSGDVTIGVRAGRTYYIRVDDTSVLPGGPGVPGTPIVFTPLPNVLLTLESARDSLEGELLFSLLGPVRHGGNAAPVAKVYLPDGKTPVTLPWFQAQLYIGEDLKTLAPAGPQQPFYSSYDTGIPSSWLGTFRPAAVYTPGVSAYHPIYAQVRVWDSTYGDTYETALANGGLCGSSRPLLVITGSEVIGPGSLIDITSFRLNRP